MEVPGRSPGRRTYQARVYAGRELTAAYELFGALGIQSFAERTRRELLRAVDWSRRVTTPAGVT